MAVKLLMAAFSLLATITTALQINATPPTNLPPANLIQKAANLSTGNPGKCFGETRFFPQAIDHSTFSGDWNDSNSTFLQQYQINDTFYKPGGPILFLQSIESDEMSCIGGSMVDWAQKMTALMVVLEHRYFGISCPYGLKYANYTTWETRLMKPLTLNNVLQDGILFLSWIKTAGYPSVKNALVLINSGSYGGVLASLYRVHYPDYIYGAVAASPVNKLISDPTDPLTFGWADWTNMVLGDLSLEAQSKTQQGFKAIRDRMYRGNFTGLQEQLGLCEPPNSTRQTTELMQMIFYQYLKSLQLNTANAKYPFYRIVNSTLAEPNPITAVAKAIAIYDNSSGAKCLDWHAPTTGAGPFEYIKCTQVPLTDPYAADATFGPILPDYSKPRLRDSFCQSNFGVDSIDGGETWARSVGLDQHTLENTSRLLITQGLLDPGVAYGPSSWSPGTSRNDSRNMFVSLSAHVEVLSPAASSDSDALKQARVDVMNTVTSWFGSQ